MTFNGHWTPNKRLRTRRMNEMKSRSKFLSETLGVSTWAAGVLWPALLRKKSKKKNWRSRSEFQATNGPLFSDRNHSAQSLPLLSTSIRKLCQFNKCTYKYFSCIWNADWHEWIWSSHFYPYLSSSEKGLKNSGLNADSRLERGFRPERGFEA